MIKNHNTLKNSYLLDFIYLFIYLFPNSQWLNCDDL